jgi:hypothetical protein
MKPLPVDHLAVEDESVLAWWCWHRDSGYTYLADWYAERNQRDWMLMYHASTISQFGPAAITLDGIDCRGWTQE